MMHIKPLHKMRDPRAPKIKERCVTQTSLWFER